MGCAIMDKAKAIIGGVSSDRRRQNIILFELGRSLNDVLRHPACDRDAPLLQLGKKLPAVMSHSETSKP